MPEPTVRPPHESPDGLARRGSALADRYRLYEQVGVGGMSVVYRGHDTVLDRPVAVKIAHIDDPAFRRCLREEARAFGRLNHPRIAQIHDFGETADGQCYIIMELVTGKPLAGWVTTRPLDPPAAIRIAAEVAEALAAVHAAGLVHRDVKPENVIITSSGAKLVDFGISAPVGGPDGDPDGQLLGTPAYVAPERITDAPVGPASDVYSLGVLLYCLLTGITPFRGRSRTEILEAHLTDDPAPLPAITGLPAEIADLCAACLARDPLARPTAVNVAAILTAAYADPMPLAEGRRRRRLVLTTGAVVLVLAAAGWAAGLDRDTGPAAADTPPPGCRVTFAVVRDTGSQFTATLTVTNLGPAINGGWRLDLILPSAQRITSATSDGDRITVTQTANLATLQTTPSASLAASAAAHMDIRATYDGTNLLPADFRLNGRPCRAGLAGAVDTTSTPSPAAKPTGTHTPTANPAPGATVTATSTAAPAPTTSPTAAQPATTPPSVAPAPSPTPPPPPPKPKPSRKPKPTNTHH